MNAPKKCALIIEDEADLLDALADTVEKVGLTVSKAKTTDEARIRMNFQKFDVIFLDINLPGENGLKFLTLLHSSSMGNTKVPPVVIVTSVDFKDDHKAKITKSLGVELFLSKPWTASQVRAYLHDKILSPGKRNYDVALINVFLTATTQTITLNTQIAPIKESPMLKDDTKSQGDFTGVIMLTGKKIRGAVAISFERKCIEALARALFQDENFAVNDDILRDVAGEMCNQVAGGAQALFQKGGTRLEISTPTIITGSGHRIVHKMNAPCLVLPFQWQGSRFFTEFIMVRDETADVTPQPEVPAKEEEQETDSGDVVFL